MALRRNNRKCGLCGDAFDGPQDHDDGGKYSTGVIGQAFTFGIKDIEVLIQIEAHSGGYFEFRLCPCDDRIATEECFKRYRLAIREGLQQGNPMRYYPIQSGLIGLTLALPFNMQCNRCVLQWHYVSGKIWGQNPRGPDCLDCVQEEYYNCADIRIGSPYNYTFAPPRPSFPLVPKELKHVSSMSSSVSVVNDGVKHPHLAPAPIPPPPSPPQNAGSIISNNHHARQEVNGHDVSVKSLIVEAKNPMSDQTLKETKGSTTHGHHEPSSELNSQSSVHLGNKIPRPPPPQDPVRSEGSNQFKSPNINAKLMPVDSGIPVVSATTFNAATSINNAKEKLLSETMVNISASSDNWNSEKSLQIVPSLNVNVKSMLNSNTTNVNHDNGVLKPIPDIHSIAPVSSLGEGSSHPNVEHIVAAPPSPKKIINVSHANVSLNGDVNKRLNVAGVVDTLDHAQPSPPVASLLSTIAASHVPSFSPLINSPLHQTQPRRPPPPLSPSQALGHPASLSQPVRPPQAHVSAPAPPQPLMDSNRHLTNVATVSQHSPAMHSQMSPQFSRIQQRPDLSLETPSQTRFFQPGERQFRQNTWPVSSQGAWSTQNRGFGANSWDMPNQQFDGPQIMSNAHQSPMLQSRQPRVQWSQRSQSVQFPQRSHNRQQSPRQNNQNDIFSQADDFISAFDEFREFIE